MIHSKLLSRASWKQLALKSLSSKLNPMIFKDRTSYVQIAVTLDETFIRYTRVVVLESYISQAQVTMGGYPTYPPLYHTLLWRMAESATTASPS
jgi:hypothetical protein